MSKIEAGKLLNEAQRYILFTQDAKGTHLTMEANDPFINHCLVLFLQVALEEVTKIRRRGAIT